MKTKVTFYFMRNGDHTTWTAVTDPGMDVDFELGDDCFEGAADDISAWCEENGYQCVVHKEYEPRFIDWESKGVFRNEQEYLEYKKQQKAANVCGDWK